MDSVADVALFSGSGPCRDPKGRHRCPGYCLFAYSGRLHLAYYRMERKGDRHLPAGASQE